MMPLKIVIKIASKLYWGGRAGIIIYLGGLMGCNFLPSKIAESKDIGIFHRNNINTEKANHIKIYISAF